MQAGVNERDCRSEGLVSLCINGCTLLVLSEDLLPFVKSKKAVQMLCMQRLPGVSVPGELLVFNRQQEAQFEH